jgi:tRNA-Thr(GGU) m(6)t(6)A37 methyltransferase TsaA
VAPAAGGSSPLAHPSSYSYRQIYEHQRGPPFCFPLRTVAIISIFQYPNSTGRTWRANMTLENKRDSPITFRSIGTIHTPFLEATGTPIQPVYSQNAEGRVLVHESYTSALDDLDGFEHIWLIYWMDRVGPFKPRVVPYRDTQEHGLFATRSPNRPNAIGISVVRLLRREGRILHISHIDILDGTQLLDIKPYVPQFDSYPNSRAGWFDKAGVDRRLADGRFHSPDRSGISGAE